MVKALAWFASGCAVGVVAGLNACHWLSTTTACQEPHAHQHHPPATAALRALEDARARLEAAVLEAKQHQAGVKPRRNGPVHGGEPEEEPPGTASGRARVGLARRRDETEELPRPLANASDAPRCECGDLGGPVDDSRLRPCSPPPPLPHAAFAVEEKAAPREVAFGGGPFSSSEEEKKTTPKTQEASAPLFFLVGLMMHVERATDYLSSTLAALARSELAYAPRAAGSSVIVATFDASPTPSRTFAAAKDAYAAHPLFDFLREEETPKETTSQKKQQQRKSAARQARDVARALRALDARYAKRGGYRYALLLEDDWLPCRGLLSAVVSALETSLRYFGRDLSAVRVSYGLNGVLVPSDRVQDLAAFVDRKAGTTPPDHAFAAWATAAGTLATFRHNAFVHVGSQSSIGNSGARWNAACYELLFDWLQRDTEAFDVNKCAHDVVSPCRPKSEGSQQRSLSKKKARASPEDHVAPWNPVPDRRHKDFNCDVALMDLPAYRTSSRLLTCLRNHIPHHQGAAQLLAKSRRRR